MMTIRSLRTEAIRDDDRGIEGVEYDPNDNVVAGHDADLGDPPPAEASSVRAPSSDTVSPTDDDWIKAGTWDIRVGLGDGVPKLVENLDELWQSLGVVIHDTDTNDQRPDAILWLMQLPAWTPAPARVKEEAHAYLRGEYAIGPETKGIRRVSTPAESRQYHLLIGAPIVTRKANVTGHPRGAPGSGAPPPAWGERGGAIG